MDPFNSVKGYRKVNEMEEHVDHRKDPRKSPIIKVFVIVLLAFVVVGATIGTAVEWKKSNSSQNPPSTAAVDSIKNICNVTQYQDACISSMKNSNITDPEQLFKLSLQVAMDEVSKSSSLPKTFGSNSNESVKAALSDCQDLFEDAVDRLNMSLLSMQPAGNGERLLSQLKVDDLKTWLSAVLTDQETCLDGLGEVSTELRDQMSLAIKNSTQFTSNSLAIASKIFDILKRLDIPIHRKLLGL